MLNARVLAAGICLAAGSMAADAGINAPIDLRLIEIETGFSNPVVVRNAGDGSNRLFVVEQTGDIRIVRNGTALPTPFVSIAVACCGERGLLGLAFHPDYANNGYFYVNHSNASDGYTVIARYQVSAGNPDVANPNSRLELMTIRQDFGNHNGGDLHFGPDGYLYVGMGDGGQGGDPCNRSQRLDPDVTEVVDPDNNPTNIVAACMEGDADPTSALLGKMIRIDVDGTTPAGNNNLCAAAPNGSAPYAIPNDNPFRNDANACAETWALGLRNPYRFSFDRETGDLFIGDVGQSAFEEISYRAVAASAGGNFGWDCREGFGEYDESGVDVGNPSPACSGAGALIAPIADYPHPPLACASVTGGFRSRGPLPPLAGIYVYADYCMDRLFFLRQSGNTWQDAGEQSVTPTLAEFSQISGFGEDEQGFLYLVEQGTGGLYRIGDQDAVFATGFD